MGKQGGRKLQAFCVNRIRPLVRVRSPPPLHNKLVNQPKPNCMSKNDQNQLGDDQGDCTNFKDEDNAKNDEKLKESANGRKIMVVIDSSGEAKVALQWALTHTVQNHDIVILLYVAKLTKQGTEETNKTMSPKVYQLLHSMKKTCQTRRPEVEVEIKMAQGKEKGPTIVEEARKQGVSLLVLGQKKRSTTWRLLLMWASNKVATATTGVGSGGGMVEYCIQNAECMALAVRKKSKKIGGYLITTKRHKDFWLLA